MSLHPTQIKTRYGSYTDPINNNWVEELGASLLDYYKQHGFIEDKFYGTLNPSLKEKVLDHLNKQEVQ